MNMLSALFNYYWLLYIAKDINKITDKNNNFKSMCSIFALSVISKTPASKIWAENYRRLSDKGMSLGSFGYALIEYGFSKIELKQYEGMILSKVLKDIDDNKTYAIIVKNHVLVVKNGEINDTLETNMDAIVIRVYDIIPLLYKDKFMNQYVSGYNSSGKKYYGIATGIDSDVDTVVIYKGGLFFKTAEIKEPRLVGSIPNGMYEKYKKYMARFSIIV